MIADAAVACSVLSVNPIDFAASSLNGLNQFRTVGHVIYPGSPDVFQDLPLPPFRTLLSHTGPNPPSSLRTLNADCVNTGELAGIMGLVGYKIGG